VAYQRRLNMLGGPGPAGLMGPMVEGSHGWAP